MYLSRRIPRYIRHGNNFCFAHRRSLHLHSANINGDITLPEHIIIEYLKSDHEAGHDIQTIEKLGSIISNLPISKQTQILQEANETAQAKGDSNTNGSSSSTLVNIQLQLYLKNLPDESNYSQIYKFIVRTMRENESMPFLPQLIETYLFNLLQIDNLTSVSSLLHILYNESSPAKAMSLSNQFWSMFLSQVCQSSHYLGALIVYHHLIDNYQFYDSDNYSTYLNGQNNHIQFLVTPNAIEALAVIFQNNNNVSHVKGLKSYFKRFYSYANHRQTLKTLKICLIECYSNQHDLKSALYHFRDLNYNLRGNYIYNNNSENSSGNLAKINWAKVDNFQRLTNQINHQWNQTNIETNSNAIPVFPDDLKSSIDELHEKLSSNLYNPDFERNIYSNQHNSTSLALINGTVQTNDLPSFQDLITNYIQEMRNNGPVSASDFASNLLAFINSNHFNLSTLIINGLAELKLFNEAYLVLTQLSSTFNKVHERNLIKLENFANIFHNVELQLQNAYTDHEAMLVVLGKFMQFYHQLDVKFSHTLPSQMYINYLDIFLSHSSTGSTIMPDVLPYVKILQASKDIPCFGLSKEPYDHLFKLCNDFEKRNYFHSGFIKRV